MLGMNMFLLSRIEINRASGLTLGQAERSHRRVQGSDGTFLLFHAFGSRWHIGAPRTLHPPWKMLEEPLGSRGGYPGDPQRCPDEQQLSAQLW